MKPFFEQTWINNEIIVYCQSGLEKILAQEIRNLGIKVVRTLKRAVICSGNTEDIIMLNMALRTALNVTIPIKRFSVSSYDMLYYRSRKIHWHKLFSVDNTLRIDVKGSSSSLPNTQYVVHRVKDAIMDTFRKFYDGKRPSIDKRNPDIHIIVYVHEKEVTILLDSSGAPLFKRGYRQEHGAAPLKEDLAASLLYLMEWDKKTPIVDPFCGTGTILIEAYLLHRNIPPNLFRTFAFHHWKNFNSSLYQKVRNQLLSKIQPFSSKPFIGIEKDPKTARMSKNILKELNIDNEIQIIEQPFQQVKKTFSSYMVITNPPYGERLEEKEKVKSLYRDFNSFLQQSGPFYSVGILTANHEAILEISLHKKRTFDLYNGPLKVSFYVFSSG